ncbi:MAG: F0F1 ATP synthase subunit A [Ruminococcaceae bacterium]|nr:F0F1 ATP synthase subunit A [Oscillospiraceae bacterium]
MNKNTLRFKIVDTLYILMMALPILGCIILKILTYPPSEGIAIRGALIYFSFPMPIMDMVVTESQINSLAVLIAVWGLCMYLTHGMGHIPMLRRHHLAEWMVQSVKNMVRGNMGEYFMAFAPFVVSILALSGFSSLLSLFGLYPPTSDINIVSGWAILVFILITYYKMKCGPIQYIKSFGDPVPFLAPLNIISEVATPISMAFRHYGNVLSGLVISVLVATGLSGLSNMVFGFLPGFLGEFPFLQIGIPAVLSIYFDIFSGLLQAYIFAMLTMLYISSGFPLDLYNKRKMMKKQKYANAKN